MDDKISILIELEMIGKKKMQPWWIREIAILVRQACWLLKDQKGF